MGTNLTKIESRPVQGKPWEYIFYVDCQIGSSEEGTRALEALGAHCGMVKELGRYREARRAERRWDPDGNRVVGSLNSKKGIGCGRSPCFCLIPVTLSLLEVVGHADGGLGDVVPAVGGEVELMSTPKVGTLVTNPRYSARMSKLGLIS